MSSFDHPCRPSSPRAVSRRAALLLGTSACLVNAACGFTPVYGPNGSARNLQGAILADAPDDRDGFVFVGQFEERIGRASAPRYAMRYAIQTRSEGVGITPAAETTRFNLFGAVTYNIIDLESDRVVAKGLVENFTGYSATRLIVGTQSAERDARERLMIILADQVVTRLVATAPDWLA